MRRHRTPRPPGLFLRRLRFQVFRVRLRLDAPTLLVALVVTLLFNSRLAIFPRSSAPGGVPRWYDDRPLGDKLWVQDDIAREVAKELQAAIH
jgi:hypothetical protein